MSTTKRYQGRIYRIINDIDHLAYIGSTTQQLCVRMAEHRRNARKGSKHPIYKHMRKLGIDHFKILLLQNIDNCTKEELEALEHEYIAQVEVIKKDKYEQCVHKNRKSRCVSCGGSETCEHKKVRSICIECKSCKGSRLCEHNKQKQNCTRCGGVSTCQHKKQKLQCKICTPYPCNVCNKIYAGKRNYNRHCKSKMHIKNQANQANQE